MLAIASVPSLPMNDFFSSACSSPRHYGGEAPPASPSAYTPEAPSGQKVGFSRSLKRRKSKLAGNIQSKLNSLLREEGEMDWEAVRELMCYEDSLDPNYVDHRSRVATLHRAAYDGAAEIVRWCLEAGAHPDVQTAIGRTALHYACNGNRTNCIRVLLEYKANVNSETLSATTPLHVACSYEKYEAVLELFKASDTVDIDAEDSKRRIPEQLTKNVAIKRAIRNYRTKLDDQRKAALLEHNLKQQSQARNPASKHELAPLKDAGALLSKLQSLAAREADWEEVEPVSPRFKQLPSISHRGSTGTEEAPLSPRRSMSIFGGQKSFRGTKSLKVEALPSMGAGTGNMETPIPKPPPSPGMGKSRPVLLASRFRSRQGTFAEQPMVVARSKGPDVPFALDD